MKPKLDLRKEVSAPCWAWEWIFTKLRVADNSMDSWIVSKGPPAFTTRTVRVRIISERAWRQIRRELKGKR